MPFKIRVAESAGFCFGVQKALDKLIDIRNNTGEPVRTLGPLIHNDQVLEALEHRQVTELQTDESVAGKHVVLRAHGVTPEKRRQLHDLNAIVCDATCPKVGQVQAIVKKFSRRKCPVVIIGDRGHAEVEGLLGYSGEMGIVITGPKEASEISGGEEVCVVAQTTQDPLVFFNTVEIIKEKYMHCHVFNTICDATTERQAETQTLADESDLMVIVGGRHSANTRRLAEIAGKNCATVMIQTADDVQPAMFKGVRRVGVTAGASTPAWVIRHVVEKIRRVGWDESGILFSLVYSTLYVLMTHPLSWAFTLGLVNFTTAFVVTSEYAWFCSTIITILAWTWKSLAKRTYPLLDMAFLGLLVIISAISLSLSTSTSTWQVPVAVLYLATLYFSQLFLCDCLHVQADKISGQLTLPVLCKDNQRKPALFIATGIHALSAALLAVVSKNPAAAILILSTISFILFFFKRLNRPGWCDLTDNLYLNAPLWLMSLLAIVIQFSRSE